jgi:hypothetical protein
VLRSPPLILDKDKVRSYRSWYIAVIVVFSKSRDKSVFIVSIREYLVWCIVVVYQS